MDYTRPRLFPGLLLLAVLLLVGLASAALASGPRAVVMEREFTVEPVRQGLSVKHDFEVSNRGDMPLEIFKVKPS
jgi:hypothetical protein